MDRRTVLRAAAVTGPAVALSGGLFGSAAAAPAQTGPSPYGAPGAADANGIQLPAGFTARVVARSRQQIPGTGYTWHDAPDGGACYPDPAGTGGWCYVSNSEMGSTGGASVVRFDASGRIVGANRILANTNRNCAGGATPWGTWLSCEEVARGYVYETLPYGPATTSSSTTAIQRPAMGRFNHEAAAVDPDRRVVYLTEDETNGCFYRFVPSLTTSRPWGQAGSRTTSGARPSTGSGTFSAGTLQVMSAGEPRRDTWVPVSWTTVPDAAASRTQTRDQVRGAKRFNGGEGCYYARGMCWFTTKGDNRVWVYDAAAQRLGIAYDDNFTPSPPLTGVDNITGTAGGDLFVAEDGGNMEIIVITREGTVAPFLRVTGQNASELCGPAFSPDGRRLYFSSQRGPSNSPAAGVTYEVTGPFRA